MPDLPKVAVISASINRGEEYSPESFTVTSQINAFPVVHTTVRYTLRPEVAAPVSSDILTKLSELQAQRLAGRSETDIQLVASDGMDGDITFDGYLSSPILALSSQSTSDTFSVVGYAALLDSLDLSIYAQTIDGVRTQAPLPPAAAVIEAAEKGDVVGVIRAATEALVGDYAGIRLEESDTNNLALMDMQHSINTSGPLEVWYELLNNSSVTFKSWEDFNTAHTDLTSVSRRIGNRTTEMLTSKTPGFWNTARAMMASFQMYYIPDMSGAGRFARADLKVGEPQGVVDVSTSSLSIADGSPRLLQPGGVVMYASAPPSPRPSLVGPPPRLMAYFPNPILSGFIHKEAPPFWMLDQRGYPAINKAEIDETGDSEKDLSLAEVKKRLAAGEELGTKLAKSIGGVMTEYCEVVFKDIQLAQSTAVMSLPLNFSVSGLLGSRVTVNVLGSEDSAGGSFEAFVSSITHKVELTQGSSLSSSTSLRCSHVKF